MLLQKFSKSFLKKKTETKANPLRFSLQWERKFLSFHVAILDVRRPDEVF
jgi:hypothetical protein